MKNTSPCYRQVRLQDINLTDRTYSLNPFSQEPEQDVLQSIGRLGILHPPLLLKKRNQPFLVLSGRRRIEAYREIVNTQPEGQQGNKKQKDNEYITALIVSGEKWIEPLHLFATLLQHQLLGGSLTVIEQAVFFQKAAMLLEEKDLLSLLPMLRLKAKPHILYDLIALLDLEPSVQLGLHKGIIRQRSAKKLALFAPADQKQLAELINEFQLGGSKQQKLIERFFQLSKREQVSIEALLTQWRDKEQDRQLNGPQRASSLLRWLDQQYQPRLTQAEDEFRIFCSRLHLPAGVRIDHALSFEEEEVTLSIDFSSKEELARSWPKIKMLLRQE